MKYRVWSDIPKDDPVRVELYDGDATRVRLLEAQQARASVLDALEGKLAEAGTIDCTSMCISNVTVSFVVCACGRASYFVCA